MKTVIVDAVGEPCPIPVVKATKALRELGEPGTLEVRVDNEIAVQNLTRMAAGNHLPVQAEKKGEHLFVVTMEVAEPVGDAPAEEPALTCVPDARGDLVVAVDSETMGLGSDELYRFCMLAQKESVMQRNYVKEHYDDLMSDVENPMIISYLELSVSDVSALSDEEQQKVAAINKALEEGTSFAEVAGEYNESVYSTTNGFYGYIDENTASWISSASDVIPLDESVLNAALALSEGETSEWIQIDNTSDSSSSTSGTTSTGDTMVLGHVDIAGKDNIKNKDNDDAWTSLATSMIHVNDTLSSEILFDAADKLEITFADENMEARLRRFAGLDA